MKMTRRVLALLLALCLTFGNVMPAMATAIEGEEPAVTEEIVPVVSEVEETEAPAEETEAPVEETEAPVEETEAPVEETEAPVEETIAQIVDDAANASTTATMSFASTANRTVFNTSQQVWEQNGIKLTNNKGSSTSNVADYSNPARFYKSSTLIIEYPGMTKIEFTANSNSYATSLKTSLAAAGFNATASSKVVTLTLDGVNEVSFALTDGQVRMDSLTVYAEETSGPSCEHEWDDGVVTPPTCTADGYTTYTCDLCGDTKTGDVVSGGHTTDATGVCTACGDGTVLTIAEAIELGKSSSSEVYTTIKYRLTGKITEVKNTIYGNVVITDGTDSILIYGMYSANGSTRYDKMTNKPVVGDTITVYGVIGNYNGTAQMKDSWLLEHTVAPCDHTAHGTDGKCSSCGAEVNHSFESNVCTSCGASEILTIAEAIDLGETKSSGSYTSDKYYVTGVITEVYNEQYGNMYITDGEGNTLTIYGTYSADGQTSYSDMEDKPVAGDMVKLYGVIGQFNGTAQMKNGWIIERIPAAPEVYAIYFDNSVAKWDAVILCIEHENGWCQIKGEKAEGDLFAFVFDEELLEYVDPSTITRIGFCEYAGGGYTSDTAFVNNKVYNDLTITNETITVYWDNSVMALDEVFVEISCEHGGEWGPMEGHMSAFYAAKNVDGDIYEYEIPACTAGYTIWFANEPYVAEDGKTYPEPVPGSTEELAIDLTSDLLYEGDFSATVTIPAGATYYYMAYRVGGMLMSINDGEAVECVTEGMFSPYAWSITNDGEEEADFVITVAFPVGHMNNPAYLNMFVEGESWDEADGQNVATLEADNWNGYQYAWTADKDGELTLTFLNGKAGWAYTVNNYTAGIYGDMNHSYDKPAVNETTITVSAGDEVAIMVNTCGKDVYSTTPAGDVYFNAYFAPVVGIEANPFDLEENDAWLWNEEWTEAYALVNVPANSTYYVRTWMRNWTIKINDGEPFVLVDEEMDGIVLPLTNETEEDAEFLLCIAAPEEPEAPIGTWGNPEELTMGEHSVTLEEGSDGYYYTWTASESGVLTLTMTSDIWSYRIDNLTSGCYGETYANTDEEPDASQDILVQAGDELEIVINTGIAGWNADWTEYLTAPAGTVTFTASFDNPVGTETNPIEATFEWDENGSATAYVTIPAYTTYYYQAYRIGGMQMHVCQGAEDNIVDEFPLVGTSPFAPVVFSVTNDTDEEQQYYLYAQWPLGSQMNPEQIELGNFSWVAVEEGDQDGYYYTATAYKNGPVEFYFDYTWPEDVVVDLIVTNYNTCQQKTMSADGVNGVLTMDVNYEDELSIQLVAIEDAEGNWYPAAEFGWESAYVRGTEETPAWMELGKNSVKIEANDEDGYYLMGLVEDPGYLTITMSGSNWEYKIGQHEGVYNDEGEYLGDRIVWSDLQSSSNKGAKSTTVYLSGNYYLYINTANKKAATVSFTATHASTFVKVGAGLSKTLPFTDPATGKALSASSATWEIMHIVLFENPDGDDDGIIVSAEEFSKYATIDSKGKLTIAADLDMYAYIFVNAVSKKDAEITNNIVVNAAPAVDSIQINKLNWTDDWTYETVEENVTELTYVVNGYDSDFALTAVVGPETAMQDVIWTSSNTQILNVDTYHDDVDGQEGIVVASVNPVRNEKNGTVATGSVILTAAAVDGSGVKATVKVNVVLETREINVYPKGYKWELAPGKSTTMIAEALTWYNQAPTKKGVTWAIGDIWEYDYEIDDFVPYEGEETIATIDAKGTVKISSSASKIYAVYVRATALDSGVVGEDYIYVIPQAKTGTIIGVPSEYDLVNGYGIYPEVEFLDANGNWAATGYTWSTNNKKILEVVVYEGYDEEGGYYYYEDFVFNGATGKITLTATATDGSKTKASVTINVTKAPQYIELSATEANLAAGQSLTLKATPYIEYYDDETFEFIKDTAVSDKTVNWTAKVVEEIEYFDDDGYYMGSEWVEVDNTIGLTCKNGTIKTNAKKVTEPVTVLVTATANTGYASADCFVTIWPATTAVTLESYGKTISGTVTIADDDIFILDAVGAPSGDYTWKSSNEKIATIEYNVDGSVTVVPTGKAGSAKITATANDGSKKSASITIKVVNPVKSVSIDVDHMLSVAKGKTVTLSKMVTMNPEKPTNNKLVWSMEWIENLEFDEDGNVASYAIKGDGKVDKKMATLNASTGALKCVNVSDYEYVRVTFTAADGYGASGEVFVILAPNAIKGVKLWVLDGEVYEDYTKKTYTCDESFIQLVPVATNAETDKCASGLTFEVSNKNFEAGWDTANRVIVVKPIEGAANPYGKVKVTVKTMDGGNVSSYVTINFVPGK